MTFQKETENYPGGAEYEDSMQTIPTTFLVVRAQEKPTYPLHGMDGKLVNTQECFRLTSRK